MKFLFPFFKFKKLQKRLSVDVRTFLNIRKFCQDVTQVYEPLKGIRILDLTRVLAGPYCTMLLGDLGAEVIKVERPGIGDDTRSWGPPWVAEGHAAYFHSCNRNKKSIGVNLKCKEGSDLIKQLAKKCDVLVENYVPGKLSELGLGYQNMKEVNPRLIYTSITGFGQTGPYANRPGYDNIAAALGGLMHITGPEDGEPCRVGVAMTDMSTGLYAYGSIMAALLHRQHTGKGQYIDTNLLSTQVASLTHVASNYLNCGLDAKRYGTGHSSLVPYQAFQTKDSYIITGAGNDAMYEDMCNVMNLKHLISDPKFIKNKDRVVNRKELLGILKPVFLEKTTKEWMKVFEHSSVPFAPINSIQEVFEDEQVIHNDMIQEIDHSVLGKIRVAGPAVRYSEGKLKVKEAPPLLGQHTDEVLKSVLGFTTQQIQDMRDNNVVH